MINIKSHKVNLPSKVIEKCWEVYSQKYKNIESSLNASPGFLNKELEGKIHSMGGFQIRVSSFKGLPKDSLTSYFSLDNTNSLVIKLNTKWVFRGADYYVGMQKISNLQKVELIFSRLSEMLEVLGEIKSSSNVVLYLSLLDHIRNYVLLLLYAIHQCARERGVSKDAQKHYLVLLELIEQIESSYLGGLITAKVSTNRDYPDSMNSLLFFRNYLRETVSAFGKSNRLSQDIFRRIREADNPIKILDFARNVSGAYLSRDCVLIGVEYGGIELPFAVNTYRQLEGKSKLDVLTINLSSYSIASKRYVDEIGDALSPFYTTKILEKYNTALILEDSITTGRTVEYLCNLLPENIRCIYFRCISFTNTNRYHHLTRFEHGGVNPFIFDRSTALYPSTYTKTYTKKRYTNKSGVFDKEKNRIIKMQKDYYPELIN